MQDPQPKRRRLNDVEEHHSGNDHGANGTGKTAQSTQERGASSGRAAEVGRAAGLSKSSLFKLQTDELLAELRPDYDNVISRIQTVLRKIKDTINNAPERPEKQARAAQKELLEAHKIMVPFPQPVPDENSKYPMSFLPPADVSVIGNLYLRAGVRSTEVLNIDLAVTMPKAMFQAKDFRNYRFFHKRAYYIACIAAALKGAHLPFTMQYSYDDGDSLRPIIVMEPTEDAPVGSRFRIRIMTALEDETFPISHTLPNKNNIRTSDSAGQESSSAEETPTSFYNAALRSEIAMIQYQKWLQSKMKQHDSMRDACTLGHIWLGQRGFSSSIEMGGFGSFEWMVLIGLLFESGGPGGKPVLLSSYSSYQIFKATLQFLSGRDLMHPFLLFANDVQSPAGEPVLYDGKRGLNILYKMTAWSYKLLRRECKLALSLLNDPLFDNFNKVFILQADNPMLRFDRLVYLAPQSKPAGSLSLRQYQNRIYHVLERSLGDRADAINIWTKTVPSWSLAAKASSKIVQDYIYIGLQLNSENVNRLVDHGPPVESQSEALSFREFWGEKSELRRFRDGRILESLVWSEQESVVDQIIVYSLCRHLKVSTDSLRCFGDEFDRALLQFSGSRSHTPSLFQKIYDAFQSLQSSLQNMDDIPLLIRQLRPSSTALRDTATISDQDSMMDKPVDIVLQLESSAKWPDDLVGIQMTKVAFLERIGDLLRENGAIHSFKIGLENEGRLLMNQAFLDTVHTSGFTFRLRLHHDREAILLERKLKESDARSRENAGAAFSEYKKTFVQSPRLTQTIKTLSTRFPLLSPTVRLMKYWFDSHLISQVTEEFVELVTIHTFVSLQPWDPPSSLMSGFYRTLTLLSKWNWKQEPLILNMGDLDSDNIKAIETRFSAWRNIDPAMKRVTMIIASDIDHDGVSWTLDNRPPKVVAGHISRLAQVAVEALGKNPEKLDLDNLFKPHLTPYDFLIHLDNKQNNKISKLPTKFKNLELPGSSSSSKSQNLGRLYVDELGTLFGNCALFFYSDEQRDVIAGLWKPESTSVKSLSLKAAYSSAPTGDDQNPGVVLNKKAILNEIVRLGGSLVRSVDYGGH
ncbi:hypothetical protein PISL3812_00618 [Talaromyces islandicus]|uniref:U3 small nucleolar RNA-associated protein 22 n=1 Tax=Talaromyces islandicus TaxID=28573 RepID=A0A0U1LJS0_TALIS|nr:hypothetical protein PISL3812_00618 [Talaromyces islandicus]